MSEWWRTNRRYVWAQGSFLALLAGLGSLYFLWGHTWLHGDSGELRAGLARCLGQEFTSPQAFLSAADEVAVHLLLGALLLGSALLGWVFRPTPPSRPAVAAAVKWSFLAALYLCVAQTVVFANARDIGLHNYSPMPWDETMHYRGYLRSPRPLLPLLINFTAKLIPAERRAELQASLRESDFFQALSRRTVGLAGYELELVIGLLYNVLFLAAAMGVLARLAMFLYEAPASHTQFAIPLFAGLFLPVLYSNTFYIYDMACIFFCTLGYYLIARRRLLPFLLLYPLAVANKETAIVLSVTFAWFYLGRLPWRPYLGCLALQGAVYLGFRALMLGLLGEAAGTLMSFTIAASLYWLFSENLWYFLRTVERSAYYYWLLFLPALVAAACWRLPRKHPVLLRLAAPATLFFVPCILALAVCWEWRDYYELYPLFVLLAYESIGPLFEPCRQRPDPCPQMLPDSLLARLAGWWRRRPAT